jgi:hypothetical protein
VSDSDLSLLGLAAGFKSGLHGTYDVTLCVLFDDTLRTDGSALGVFSRSAAGRPVARSCVDSGHTGKIKTDTYDGNKVLNNDP